MKSGNTAAAFPRSFADSTRCEDSASGQFVIAAFFIALCSTIVVLTLSQPLRARWCTFMCSDKIPVHGIARFLHHGHHKSDVSCSHTSQAASRQTRCSNKLQSFEAALFSAKIFCSGPNLFAKQTKQFNSHTTNESTCSLVF